MPLGTEGGCAGRSLLAQHEVHDPAPADVLTTTSAVVEDVVAGAARVLERVGQYRHRGEVTRLVHLSRQRHRRARAPRGVERRRTERVAVNLPKEVGPSGGVSSVAYIGEQESLSR